MAQGVAHRGKRRVTRPKVCSGRLQSKHDLKYPNKLALHSHHYLSELTLSRRLGAFDLPPMLESNSANSALQKEYPTTKLMPFTYVGSASVSYSDALYKRYPASSLLPRVVWEGWGKTHCLTDHTRFEESRGNCEGLSSSPQLPSPLLVIACTAALQVFSPVRHASIQAACSGQLWAVGESPAHTASICSPSTKADPMAVTC